MTRSKRILPGSRLQWGAWLLALALHALVLLLIGPQQAPRPAPPPVMMALLPTAPKVELAPPVTPAQPAPASAQPVQRPTPAAPAPVLASTAAQPGAAAVPAAPAQPEPPAPLAKAVAPAEPPVVPVPAKPAAPALRPAVYRAAYLNNPEPAYPPMSRRAGETGRVMLEVAISAEGRAQSVKLHTSSAYPRLDMAAIEAVRNWRFEPAREGERAVASLVQIPVDFTLE